MWNEFVIRLSYGKEGIELRPESDWNLTVVEPFYPDKLHDAKKSLSDALRRPLGCQPLRELAGKNTRVGIVFNDITRPTPNRLIIETLLQELEHVPRESITLFNALGTHRPNTMDELREILGDYLVYNYRVIQNNAYDQDTQEFMGETLRGNKVWLNKELALCDLKILTGFIEPHFFAGFSGGGKALMPGMAGLSTILHNHSTGNIGNPYASWGITERNPIWSEIREVFSMTGRSFLVNVTLNREKEITRIFAGDPHKAHDTGIEFARGTSMVPVEKEFDIVVTTNSGYPLDINLYQTVKGMSAAARIVKPGGVIIAAAECRDGIPEHGNFGEMLRKYPDPATMSEVIRSPGFSMMDQWQVQILAQIQLRAEIYLYSDMISQEQLGSTWMKKCTNINGLIEEFRKQKGKDITVCVLPEGPQTIPFLASNPAGTIPSG